MTNFVNGQPNNCKTAKIDSLSNLTLLGVQQKITIITDVYNFLKEIFMMAQVFLRYIANTLMNRKGGGVAVAKRSK